MIKCLLLDEVEQKSIASLIENDLRKLEILDWNELLYHLSLLSCGLPCRLLKFVKDFQISIRDKDRLCMISNLMVKEAIETPSELGYKYSITTSSQISFRAEVLICLVASLLGEVFGWKAEQNGRLVHDIIPLKKHENSQESTGSHQVIHWHTEEAFHTFASDYLALFCIKNEQKVATTYCSISSLDLSDSIYDILFEPRFIFKKVLSHQSINHKEEVYMKSVLYGDRKKPFIRIDYHFMDLIEAHDEARVALEKLINLISNSLNRVVLKPGDLLLIDNALCVHGRDSFIPNYDGNDRWLKRVNITRDLYKSRDKNNPITSRLVV